MNFLTHFSVPLDWKFFSLIVCPQKKNMNCLETFSVAFDLNVCKLYMDKRRICD